MVKIIAEAGINHQGDMELAKQMIVLSRMAGADVWKTQWYDPLEILGRDNPNIEEAKKAQFTPEQHKELKEYCDWAGIEWAVSVFHPEHVAVIEAIGQKFYKVASRAALNERLLLEIAKTGKPVVLSTGLLGEGLKQKLCRIRNIFRNNILTLLYCVCDYPTRFKDILLGRMIMLNGFSDAVGFSSHCPNITPSLAAVAYGAEVIENHVVVDKLQVGCDVSSSITFEQLTDMCGYIDEMEQL